MAYLQYDPNKPGDRERAYDEFFLGFIFFGGSIASIIYFIYSVVSLIRGNASGYIIISFILLIVMAVIDFFIISSGFDKKSKKRFARSYFLLFCGATFDVVGIIAIIMAIYSLCHKGTDGALLIIAVIGVLLTTIITILIYRKINGFKKIKWFTDKSLQMISENVVNRDVQRGRTTVNLSEVREDEYIFCHKCGKKLPNDSGYCSTCGTKLK